jgi:hypothetical protein
MLGLAKVAVELTLVATGSWALTGGFALERCFQDCKRNN